MSAIDIVWVDLRAGLGGPSLARQIPERYAVTRVDRDADFAGTIRAGHPRVACLEFDFPDEARLATVPKIIHAFPDLPLLVFTEYHSEALAVQAFRWGVWDYRVKPVSRTILARSLEFAAGRLASRGLYQAGHAAMPANLVAPGGQLLGPVTTTVRTAAASAYIAKHCAEPIRRDAMARLCHLSESEFSRTFRREHGCTFERFLLAFRIGKARDLLAGTPLTILQVAHATGFNDSSYFARAFRLLSGYTASDWRLRAQGAVVARTDRAP